MYIQKKKFFFFLNIFFWTGTNKIYKAFDSCLSLTLVSEMKTLLVFVFSWHLLTNKEIYTRSKVKKRRVTFLILKTS